MYHLLSGLWEHLTRKQEFNVIILGLDNAGKTTFLEKVKSVFNATPDVDPSKIGPTVGQNLGRITLSSSVLQFWDLGGQRDFRAIWPKYYQDSHAVVFVIDSTDPSRFDEVWSVFQTILKDKRIEGVPTLILANKQDDASSVPVETIKEHFNKQIANLNISECAVMSISALKGTGIRQATDWLLIRVQNSRTLATTSS